MPLTPAHRPSFLTPHAKGVLAAVVTVVIWTAFIVVARASADPARGGVLNPFDIVYARIWGASLVLLPWGWWLVRRARRMQPAAGSFLGLSPLPLRTTVQVGFFGGLLYAMLAYSGFVFAPAAHASVLMPGSLPLWTALLAIGVLGDRMTRTRALGLVFIVGGDVMVGGSSLLHALDGSGVWRGDLLFMGASFVWSIYSVLARRFALQAVQATIAITVFAFCTYVPVYTALLLLQWVPGQVLQAPWTAVGFQMLMQGVGSVVISGISFTRMIQHFGPVRSTMITALVPGLSAMAAVIFLGEPLGWNLVVGLVLVTAGILFGVRQSKQVAPDLGAAPALSTGSKA
ncbi:MAG: EamA family transporter [Burkholderiales bacterium PBB4]|nr:MAG: EamA family transporter [Burkholderiales bacterium PBB4]